jgi:hypothetical protein
MVQVPFGYKTLQYWRQEIRQSYLRIPNIETERRVSILGTCYGAVIGWEDAE